MEHLIFTCPTTGREVDSGVESEIGTLLRIRQQSVRGARRAANGTTGQCATPSWPEPLPAPAPAVTSPDSCRGCAAPSRP
jgi:hypothetical protein